MKNPPQITQDTCRGGSFKIIPLPFVSNNVVVNCDKMEQLIVIAVKVLGDETLRTIARELVATVRSNVTIDWTLHENVRAHLRTLVKCILCKHGYPPDKQEKATQTVLEQAELFSAEWAMA